MLLQVGGAVPGSFYELLQQASGETKAVLAVTALFSIVTWFIIGLKWWQFRRIRQQADKFFTELERTTRLQEAYAILMKQPPSPYNRLFREGMHFYSELRPGALRDDAPATRASLTMTQLEALKMVLGKEVSAERELAAHLVPWLATIGAVSPLLGLLGTVLGVMRAFVGIAQSGSGNISAVAPGVAEALITTVAGLAVAIPAVMAYNYFAVKVGNLEGQLDGFGSELVGWMARERLL